MSGTTYTDTPEDQARLLAVMEREANGRSLLKSEQHLLAEALRYFGPRLRISQDRHDSLVSVVEHARNFLLDGSPLDLPDGCTKDENIAALCFRARCTIDRLEKRGVRR